MDASWGALHWCNPLFWKLWRAANFGFAPSVREQVGKFQILAFLIAIILYARVNVQTQDCTQESFTGHRSTGKRNRLDLKANQIKVNILWQCAGKYLAVRIQLGCSWLDVQSLSGYYERERDAHTADIPQGLQFIYESCYREYQMLEQTLNLCLRLCRAATRLKKGDTLGALLDSEAALALEPK